MHHVSDSCGPALARTLVCVPSIVSTILSRVGIPRCPPITQAENALRPTGADSALLSDALAVTLHSKYLLSTPSSVNSAKGWLATMTTRNCDDQSITCLFSGTSIGLVLWELHFE
mmetsp:Transcript_11513/g.35525  ORF Transcript_11513/g.35525 Transcript_11513/m.35525 type:complete len:115 (-) Transcript_11513:327-671(-)